MEENKVTVQERNISDKVLGRVQALASKKELILPVNYSMENALKSAYLILSELNDKSGNPVLKSCTEVSIAGSLLDMVVQGLSPVKKQCYFICYGKKLQLMRSYMGTVAVTKRLKGVKNVIANIIYEGDKFSYKLDLETGFKVITEHDQSFENIDNTKIKGAYAIVVLEDGQNYIEIMNINQIRMAWSKSKTGGQVHKDFAEEMAKKSVISRACKMFANTSDDSDLLIGAFNNSEEKIGEEGYLLSDVQSDVKDEIKENANKEELDIEKDETPIMDAEIITETNKESNKELRKETNKETNKETIKETSEENDPY
ncbi:recombinase RecT [Clostridium estertheticum]|uniref:recombinase RecT n=1 Tax=Clostridium estertheticum TaxID=238834 RepID=UPI00124E67AB|nr:RecT family recombinase [Clostridium estertheticum]MBZ9615329.1 recombinase RecT [Clostridium estertheticum subsp. laramiense]WAG75218.1 recombinase RecT [Clostridium estertheticum]